MTYCPAIADDPIRLLAVRETPASPDEVQAARGGDTAGVGGAGRAGARVGAC
ncbi:Putative molybdenum cofactor biosynthesis protein [Streptomyces venezuelae]|uniref:hypothetical protein n=1 Tax=Streptomyces gardneri TaxID=66892 RepID=UPI0006BC1C6A|nr:hypothetical protein [Streptomyces gardneri]ALO06566.1 Putative molybdenum cofactor biosynthesis protein [Streptomyces venezuelae]QPK43987.1 hypothetical protein H4W23_04750 [Streptomyces gardneri]WRK35255.1 hypothetical protein U0M97_04775 [Streptomyces venezuelae]CUM43160.1 hypothetical protein BN2537_15285 [Streptomyces venezuelae]